MSSFREIIAKRVSLDGSVSSDTGRSILAAADGAAVRTVIDAAAGTHTHVMADISNITISGSAPFPDHDVALTYSYSTGAWVTRTIGLVGVGSQPLGGWPSGSLGAALADKAGTASPVFTGVVTVAAGSAALPSIAISSDTNTGLFAPSADNLAITTGGTERLRVDSSGKILVGTTTSRSAGPAVHPAFQFEGTNAGAASFQCIAGSGQATVSPQILLARHRGGIGDSTLVQDGDTIGIIRFNGGDDTDCISNAAVIECRIDGTPGSNDMPGVLIFSTTADGSAISTERLRITSAGNVGIGTNSPSVRFHVSGNSRIDGSLNINNAFTLPTTDGTSGQVLSTNGSGTVTWQTVSGGGGISDGDKGDITVSSSGATWTIDSGAVSYAKIQNVSATDRILGRSSAGAGVVEEIACTAAGRALIDDADVAAQRTTLGLGTLATQSVEIIHPFLLGGM